MYLAKSASYAGDYRLRIRFEDGRTKVVDLGPYLDSPVFEPLRDLSYFQRFQVNKDIDAPGSHLGRAGQGPQRRRANRLAFTNSTCRSTNSTTVPFASYSSAVNN
jgi:hypothetical protein